MSVKERDQLLIDPDVFSDTRYVHSPLFLKYRINLWGYPQDLWGIMN